MTAVRLVAFVYLATIFGLEVTVYAASVRIFIVLIIGV